MTTATWDQQIAVALTADGYDPPPKPGDTYRERNTSWLPDGQHRHVTIRSLGKTVTGWQITVESSIVDSAGRTVQGPTRGCMYLDHLLGRREYPGKFERVDA